MPRGDDGGVAEGEGRDAGDRRQADNGTAVVTAKHAANRSRLEALCRRCGDEWVRDALVEAVTPHLGVKRPRKVAVLWLLGYTQRAIADEIGRSLVVAQREIARVGDILPPDLVDLVAQKAAVVFASRFGYAGMIAPSRRETPRPFSPPPRRPERKEEGEPV